jgi:hypothetical protein
MGDFLSVRYVIGLHAAEFVEEVVEAEIVDDQAEEVPA